MTGTTPPGDPFDEAVAAHEAGDLETAERIYRELLETDPDDAVVEELLGTALAASGRHEEARGRLERALRLDPTATTAHVAMAELLLTQGDQEAAERSLRACLAIDDTMRPAWLRLGLLLLERLRLGEVEEIVGRLEVVEADSVEARILSIGLAIERGAFASAQKSLEALPREVRSDPAVRTFETLSLVLLDRLDEASRLVDSLPPEIASAQVHRIGIWLAMRDRLDRAAEWCVDRDRIDGSAASAVLLGRLRATTPDLAPAFREAVAKARYGSAAGDVLAGMASLEDGDLPAASARLGRAAALHADDPDLLATCASAFSGSGRAAEALAMLDAARTRHLGHVGLLCERAHALLCLHRYREAEEDLLEALGLDDRATPPLRGLVEIHMLQGRFDEALSRCDRLREIVGRDLLPVEAAESLAGSMRQHEALARLDSQDDADRPSKIARERLYLSNFPDDLDESEVFARHAEFGGSIESADPARSESERRDALRAVLRSDSRVRIGFLSPDLRRHSVWYFLEPLLASLDRTRFEVVGISDTTLADSITARLESRCDDWLDVAGTSASSFRERVARLELDILVELAGHTSGSRLLELSRRVAPVQMSWLGYPNTTGIDAIDYRIVDGWTDPPGSEHLATETLLRMPRCFLCHMAPPDRPDPSGGRRSGVPVFGSFNNLAKITDTTVRAWSAALHAVPESRMLIKARSLREKSTADRLRRRFEAAGVAGDRLDLRGWITGTDGHLAAYREVDVALDTFPYHGTTTTCEALSMGVPVITLAGDGHRSRVGVSLLRTIGRPEWATGDVDAFAAAAVAALEPRRQSRRDLVEDTPLRDPAGFAADFAAMLDSAAET